MTLNRRPISTAPHSNYSSTALTFPIRDTFLPAIGAAKENAVPNAQRHVILHLSGIA
jgi:hypothetical protein